MGGTSTDVAHFDGEFERAFETEVAGVRMRAPMMKIHTVAAGGGSILHFRRRALSRRPGFRRRRSRPRSLPARRPAHCHRRQCDDRQADPRFLPQGLRARGDEPLDDEIVRERFAALARDIGDGRSAEAVADGFLAIAVAKMAEAIKKISVARGHDVTRYALNCFGGAGGQHACDVADALAIKTVLIHPLSSLLSAYGMGLADIRPSAAQGVEEPLDGGALARVGAIAAGLADAAVAEVEEQGVAREAIKVHQARAAALRRLRHDDRSRARDAGRDAARIRARAQEPLRLPRSRQVARDRGGVGRSRRRRGAVCRTRAPSRI